MLWCLKPLTTLTATNEEKNRGSASLIFCEVNPPMGVGFFPWGVSNEGSVPILWHHSETITGLSTVDCFWYHANGTAVNSLQQQWKKSSSNTFPDSNNSSWGQLKGLRDRGKRSLHGEGSSIKFSFSTLFFLFSIYTDFRRLSCS